MEKEVPTWLKQAFCTHRKAIAIRSYSRKRNGGMIKELVIEHYCPDCGKEFEIIER